MLLDQTWREGKAVVGESLQKGQRRRARYAQVVHGKGLEDAPRD
jgi:DNA-nicking Smr family endonuclease